MVLNDLEYRFMSGAGPRTKRNVELNCLLILACCSVISSGK